MSAAAHAKGIDWDATLSLLPRWERLSRTARHGVLAVPVGRGAPASFLMDGAREELEAAGFLQAQGARGTLVGLTEEVAPAVAGLQAAHRVPVLAIPTPATLYAYTSNLLTPGDVALALEGSAAAWSYPHPARMAARAGSAKRMEEFLALSGKVAVRRWAAKHLASALGERWDPVSLLAAVQRLVRALLDRSRPVPLGEIAALLPDLAEHHLAATLDAATRLLLVFVSVDDHAEILLGVWPPLARRLGRPLGPPQPVQPTEQFEAPWILGDATAVLVEAAAEPIRVRTDGAIFVRAARAVAERLAPIPAWLPALLWGTDDGEDDAPADGDPHDRVALGATWLEGTGLLAQRNPRGSEPRLEPTAAGRKWLALSERDRLAHLLDHVRRRKDRNPQGPYGNDEILGFFPVRLGFTLPKGVTLDVRAALTRALLSLPEDGFVSRDHFLEHRAREDNPFLVPEVRKAISRVTWGLGDEDEPWEALWMELVYDFLAMRMAPLGAMRLGRMEDGSLALGLTTVGRYLLGAADDFTVETTPETGAVVVQPDFEVVFLAPAPRAEAEIGRFAERIGKGVGATFRITRASVLRAAEAGVGEDEMVAVLRDAAGREPPANVARQLRDWLGAVRRVAIAPAVLVDCADEETAARVLAAVGKAVEALSPTVLRLTDGSAKGRTALIKKLRTAGIFVGG